jgi:MFS family permease
VDFQSENTLLNWITELKIFDESKFKLGLIGSSFFLGYFFGSFSILRLPDIYGRKYPVIVSFVLVAICSMALYAAKSIGALYVCLFTAGFFQVLRVSTTYVYIIELSGS